MRTGDQIRHEHRDESAYSRTLQICDAMLHKFSFSAGVQK